MDKAALLSRLESQALQIRRNVWRALRAGGGGHAGGTCSAADILAALYFHRLRVRPDEPDWPERDRFVLSKGHANAALGAVLAQAGFIADEVLDRFYGFESPFDLHPDIKMPGVEMCTGALGHGLAVALGMAQGLGREQRRTRAAGVAQPLREPDPSRFRSGLAGDRRP